MLYSDFSLLFDSLPVKAFLWCKSVSLFSALMLSKLSQELCSNKKYLLDVFSQLLVNLTDVISPAKNFFTTLTTSLIYPFTKMLLSMPKYFSANTHTQTGRTHSPFLGDSPTPFLKLGWMYIKFETPVHSVMLVTLSLALNTQSITNTVRHCACRLKCSLITYRRRLCETMRKKECTVSYCPNTYHIWQLRVPRANRLLSTVCP